MVSRTKKGVAVWSPQGTLQALPQEGRELFFKKPRALLDAIRSEGGEMSGSPHTA